MTRVVIFVEGELGDPRTRAKLKVNLRKVLLRLLNNAGIDSDKVRIVTCGSGNQAYKRFKDFVRDNPAGEHPILLVDSESPVNQDLRTESARPWEHLQRRHMPRFPGAKDEDAQLFVPCIETWQLVDRDLLKRFYGVGLREGFLPKVSGLEGRSSQELLDALQNATKKTTKGKYQKVHHGYQILNAISPALIESALPWAKRFFDRMRQTTPKE